MPKKRKTKSSLSLSSRAKRKTSFLTRFFNVFRMILKGFLATSSARTKTLFILGALLVVVPTFFYINEGIQLAFFTPKVPIIAKKFAVPTHISIPTLQMNLSIFETAITNGVWGIAPDGISHLNVSARPGELGPIILYGHNTNERFGPIRWLSKGAEIDIISGSKQHKYIVDRTLDVSPNQVSVLLSQKGETLILYTCDGFADLQRFIVIAVPQGSL